MNKTLVKATITVGSFTKAANVMFNDRIIPKMEKYMHLKDDDHVICDANVVVPKTLHDCLFNPIIFASFGDACHHNIRKHGDTFSIVLSHDFSLGKRHLLFEIVAQRIEDDVGVESRLGAGFIALSELLNASNRNMSITIPAIKYIVDSTPYIVAHITVSNIVVDNPPDKYMSMNEDDSIPHEKLLQQAWNIDGNSEISIFSHLKPAPGHALLHANTFLTGSRLITSSCYYALTAPDTISWNVVELLLRLGIAMYGIEEPSVDIKWKHMTLSSKHMYACAFAMGISLISKLCYYCPDMGIRRDPVTNVTTRYDDDNFSDVGMTGAGDCEDMSKLMFNIVRAIMLDFTPHRKYRLTTLCKRIFKYYVPVMVHGGVSTGSASKMDTADESDLESHYFLVMLPRRRLIYSLYCGMKSCADPDLNMRQYAAIAVPPGKDYDSFCNSLDDKWKKYPAMPVLVLEGTGFLSPTVLPMSQVCNLNADLLKHLDRLYDMKIPDGYGGVGFMKRPSCPIEKDNTCRFYKSVVAGITDGRLFMGINTLVFFTHLFEYGIPINTFLLYFSSVIDGTPIGGGSAPVLPGARCLDPDKTAMPLRVVPYYKHDPTIADMVKEWTIGPFDIMDDVTTSIEQLNISEGDVIAIRRTNPCQLHALTSDKDRKMTISICNFKHSNIVIKADVIKLTTREKKRIVF